MSLVEAIIVAIIEGLTEFLPISSTGHMILAGYLLGINENEFTKLFVVSIQFGAILAVVVIYWKKFLNFLSWQFYAKLIVGILPAVIIGLLLGSKIDALLENPMTVTITMLLGGIILLFIDNVFRKHSIRNDKDISFLKAFIVGCWQLLALVPGMSRSAASIIGGMQQKFTRQLAAEFSFFLAVPTLFAASFYTLFIKEWKGKIKGYELIMQSEQNMINFIVGNVVAFVVAILAIRLFINYLQVYGFRAFGWYRIVAGLIMLFILLTK